MVGIEHRTDTGSRPTSKDGAKKNIWSSMLDGVGSGKRLPEKTLLVLGGTPESQREFLETLSPEQSEPGIRADRRKHKAPPIANQFALGYTYQDVLDADKEDTLARVSIYLLSEPSPSFAPLLKPLINPGTVPQTQIVILLDWENPWLWVRQLREWIRLLRSVLISLDDETKLVMEEVMTDWRDRRRGLDPSHTTGAGGPTSSIPLGPGEWDEGLGIPMCVVCQGAEKIEKLEKDHGWREEEFDFILQFMRTILLKHGSSLMYTTPFLANSLQSLIHSSLGIHSLLKRQSLKHNVIDRDKILVPSNWDSWGKIRIIREGFDIEGVGTSWSIEIQEPPQPTTTTTDEAAQEEDKIQEEDGTSAVAIYEQTIQDPKRGGVISRSTQSDGNKIEVDITDSQTFLGEQVAVLEQLKAEDEKQDRQLRKGGTLRDSEPLAAIDEAGRINEHIGPVQFNMGGIQVDADDMLRRLKEREASRNEPLSPPPGDQTATSGAPPSVPTGDNKGLATFFADLVKKSSGSPRSNSTS